MGLTTYDCSPCKECGHDAERHGADSEGDLRGCTVILPTGWMEFWATFDYCSCKRSREEAGRR
jgi:hypothetical protein